MPLPSAHRNILDGLTNLNHDKWGFVIYRCTYQNDQAWDRFKQIVYDLTQQDMANSDAPEVANSLEWTLVEDPSLGGASKDQLREHHKQWATQAFATEQPRAHEYQTFGDPRYRYFIQVDEEALQSVMAAPESDLSGAGFVNFVDSQWTSMSEEFPDDEDEDGEDEDEAYDTIEGCTEEDVGWMKIAATMIDASFHDVSAGFAYGAWDEYYQRPPAMVLY